MDGDSYDVDVVDDDADYGDHCDVLNVFMRLILPMLFLIMLFMVVVLGI